MGIMVPGLHDSQMMLLTDGDNPTVMRFLTNPLLSRSHIRCCKFVPSSLKRSLCAVINNGIVPGFTNRIKCENPGCLCQHSAMAKADA